MMKAGRTCPCHGQAFVKCDSQILSYFQKCQNTLEAAGLDISRANQCQTLLFRLPHSRFLVTYFPKSYFKMSSFIEGENAFCSVSGEGVSNRPVEVQGCCRCTGSDLELNGELNHVQDTCRKSSGPALSFFCLRGRFLLHPLLPYLSQIRAFSKTPLFSAKASLKTKQKMLS